MADARTRREALAALSEDEITEFREIFNLVDRDGGGSISKKELADLLDTLGINASMVRARSAGAGLQLGVPAGWRR